MRLIFIRHADPDYEHDSLTEKGRKEASLLSDIICDLGIGEVYQSPLGRAKETADFCLQRLHKSALTFDWLKEFPAEFDPNISEQARCAFKSELVKDDSTGLYNKRIVWDMQPSYYKDHPELFDRNSWKSSDIVSCSNALSQYDYVTSEFDAFLAENGYVRDGDIYSVRNANDRTLAFFCHFGITCVLLSHLWNVSPFVPLQFLAMAPTSITEVVTEEREKGIAIFRTLRVGDISHLSKAGETPSFSARFCEKYDNTWERH